MKLSRLIGLAYGAYKAFFSKYTKNKKIRKRYSAPKGIPRVKLCKLKKIHDILPRDHQNQSNQKNKADPMNHSLPFGIGTFSQNQFKNYK